MFRTLRNILKSNAEAAPMPPDAARLAMALRPGQGGGASAADTKALDGTRRQAIVFRQHFPPPHDAGLSFFGGAPVAPPSFVWPVASGQQGREVPLHFVMQLDCAEIPAAARLGLLPDTGVLHVFLDLEWGSDAARVIHTPADRSGWAPVAPPAGLGPAYGTEARYHWKWTELTEAPCPRLLPKWPFTPVAIAIPADAYEADEVEEGAPCLWPGGAWLEAELLRAQGEAVTYRSFSKTMLAADGSIRRPFDAYPHDWRAVAICAGMIIAQVVKNRFPGGRLKDMTPEAREAFVAGIGAQARGWFGRAAAHPAFAAVPREDSDAFWQWVSELGWLTRYILDQAVIQSVEASLTATPEAAARIPVDALAHVHGRHALALRTDTGTFVTTPDRMLAPPVDVQGHQWERAQTHLLLLELSSNEGLAHFFGEGVYQFWITPEDLRARRFDKVVLTSDAY
jgi:hypothetical protein